MNELAKSLYKMEASREVPQAEWTEEFKKTLIDLGESKYKFEVWGGKNRPIGKGEWLWDLCWVNCGKKWTDLRGVYLACEIEWDYGIENQLEDFLKLTVAKAEYLLFICSVPISEKKYEILFDKFVEASKWSKKGRYLVIGVPDKQTKENLPYRSWSI